MVIYNFYVILEVIKIQSKSDVTKIEYNWEYFTFSNLQITVKYSVSIYVCTKGIAYLDIL